MIDTAAILAKHVPLYRHRYPRYQVTLLSQLESVWGDHKKVLDIGGGNGIIGQCIHEIFGANVTSIDVEDRFLPSLTIQTAVYDGLGFPFPDRSFDAITMINVLHHVPPEDRRTVLQECTRVCDGPIYVKDHVFVSHVDLLRMHMLDAMGNIPFGGMWAKTEYLSQAEWNSWRNEFGFYETRLPEANYRSRPFAALFPNRYEIFMEWTHCTTATFTAPMLTIPACGDAGVKVRMSD